MKNDGAAVDKVWICYEVNCAEELTEDLAAWVAEGLAIPVEITSTGVRFYLERPSSGGEEPGKLIGLLEDFRRVFSLSSPVPFSSSLLKGDDWANGWKSHFKPLKIGSRLLVCPTWETAVPAGAEKVIFMDPGMAFGTGHHETTRLCLEWLDAYEDRGMSLAPARSLLDVGTGSGILAMAGALLGFDPVVAVDNDPEALHVAMENVQLNGLNGKVQLKLSDNVDVSGRFHVVMANIQAVPLIDMSKTLAGFLEEQGQLVLSGILLEQRQQVQQVYEELGLKFTGFREAGEWCLLVFEKVAERKELHDGS